MLCHIRGTIRGHSRTHPQADESAVVESAVDAGLQQAWVVVPVEGKGNVPNSPIPDPCSAIPRSAVPLVAQQRPIPQ